MWHNPDMRIRYAWILIPALLLGLGGVTADATVLRGLDLTQLTDASPTILRGRVVTTRGEWKGGRIYTAVTVEVESPLSGTQRTGDRVTFWRLGGVVGNIAQRVLGSPRFRTGERVIVFLHARRGHLFVTGMVQGKVRVLPATASSPTRVAPAHHRLALRGARRVLQRAEPLTAFETRVRQLVRTRATRKGRRP